MQRRPMIGFGLPFQGAFGFSGFAYGKELIISWAAKLAAGALILRHATGSGVNAADFSRSPKPRFAMVRATPEGATFFALGNTLTFDLRGTLRAPRTEKSHDMLTACFGFPAGQTVIAA